MVVVYGRGRMWVKNERVPDSGYTAVYYSHTPSQHIPAVRVKKRFE